MTDINMNNVGMTKPEETILQKNPIMTTKCRHPRCFEIIYRDTLDKDLGYQLPKIPTAYFCSKLCAIEVLGNKLYFNMASKGVKF